MRDYKFDNIKFILIFLVVFAHLLRLLEGDIANYLCFFIYTFHMPVFVFVSGYFDKFSMKKIKRYVILYLIWQTIYIAFDKFILGFNKNFQYLTPNWIIWYLLACIVWTILNKILDTDSKKKATFLICGSVILSIIISFIDEIEYFFSLARIVTFFPFFLIGYYTKKFDSTWYKLKKGKKIEKSKMVLLLLGLVISISYFIIKKELDTTWLFGVFSYKNGNYDFILKLIWIIFSSCMLTTLMNIVKNKKYKVITNLGANTLMIYLGHGFFVKILRHVFRIFCYNELTNIILAAVISCLILILLGKLVPMYIKSIKDICDLEKK